MSLDLSRRTVLAAGAATLLATPARAAGQVIIGTWGGDYGELLAQNIDKPLVEPGGTEVLQQVSDAPPRKAKLVAERGARRGTVDVAALSDVDMFEMAQLGLFDTLQAAAIPNLPNVLEPLRRAYAIPHIYSGQVILYNPDRVNPAPRSYADLWDPKYRGRVGLADGLYLQNTAVAALVGGGSMDDYEPAKAKLREWKALGAKVYPSNETLATALKAEEVWLSVMWLARGYQWRRAGVPIRHVVPSEGATPIVFEAAIPKNAQNKANAAAYLNAMLDPRAQAGFAERMGYVPTVSNAQLPAELAAQIAFTPEQQAGFRPPNYEYVARSNSALLDFWNREFKG